MNLHEKNKNKKLHNLGEMFHTCTKFLIAQIPIKIIGFCLQSYKCYRTLTHQTNTEVNIALALAILPNDR